MRDIPASLKKEENAMAAVKTGIIGIGKISGIYLENLSKFFKNIEIVAVCDFFIYRASEVATKYSIPKVYASKEEMFAADEIALIINLTRPNEHYGVISAALEAGKHVYTEKPLAPSLVEGQELATLAASHKLLLGGAPDTFLGAGIQTCKKLIDDGVIGMPVGATAAMINRGHEHWHPDPEFYYKAGGGPMFDMGAYYLTVLINLLGGIRKTSAMARASFKQRTITSKPKYGTAINVDVPTYITGIMQFDSGVIGTIFTSFDVHYDESFHLEIYGSDATLRLPDPNTFGGPVMLYRQKTKIWQEIPMAYPFADDSRGIGVVGMANAILTGGQDFPAQDTQLLHVLEVMESFQKSSDTGIEVIIGSKFKRL